MREYGHVLSRINMFINAKAFARLISFTALTALLILCGTFFPVFGFVCMVAAATPLALLGCIDGANFLSVGILLLELFLFVTFSPLMSLYAALGCVPLAITIYTLYLKYNFKFNNNKISGGVALLICASAAIISKLLLLIIFKFLTGRNILIPDAAKLELIVNNLAGPGGGAEVQQVKAALLQSIAVMPYILPSILIIYSSFEGVVNYVLCLKILNKLNFNKKLPDLPKFQEWTFISQAKSIMPVLILTFIAGFFIDGDNWFEGAIFITNLRLILNALFFVQGLAFAVWWMNFKNFSKIARIVLIIFLLFPLMWMGLILLGVSDMAFNFRARLSKQDN
ncbi:MAG: DUF2232 domain-containing protein [Synergistaceae bacterium]|nr:DUF2232 domain-containing protein [Synergistaceae bacterium]